MAVTNTTLILEVFGFYFSSGTKRNPSITGIFTSTKMTSGMSSLTRCCPVAPLSALRTLQPLSSSCSTSRFLMSSSSSITNTLTYKLTIQQASTE